MKRKIENDEPVLLSPNPYGEEADWDRNQPFRATVLINSPEEFKDVFQGMARSAVCWLVEGHYELEPSYQRSKTKAHLLAAKGDLRFTAKFLAHVARIGVEEVATPSETELGLFAGHPRCRGRTNGECHRGAGRAEAGQAMKAQRVAGRAADRLIDELLALPPSASFERIKTDSRFLSFKIALRLTERCAAAQLERPEESKRLGTAALEVLDTLDRMDTSTGVSAACLFGNSCRLTGDLDRAESAYSSVASRVVAKADAAAYLRGLALLRWEQGRCDEAVGLLTRAERRFREAGLGPEAQATCHLLVLLHAEIGELEDAIVIFNRPEPVDPAGRPWLGARAGLTAAFCLASRSDLASPEQALAALPHGSSLIPFVRNPNELLLLEWLEARARARMGHDEAAVNTLPALRDRFASTTVTLDFLLVTLDLLAARMTAEQHPNGLLEGLKGLTASKPEIVTAKEAILFSLELPRAQGADPWRSVSSTSRMLRRLFRSFRLPVTPLPFA